MEHIYWEGYLENPKIKELGKKGLGKVWVLELVIIRVKGLADNTGLANWNNVYLESKFDLNIQ